MAVREGGQDRQLSAGVWSALQQVFCFIDKGRSGRRRRRRLPVPLAASWRFLGLRVSLHVDHVWLPWWQKARGSSSGSPPAVGLTLGFPVQPRGGDMGLWLMAWCRLVTLPRSASALLKGVVSQSGNSSMHPREESISPFDKSKQNVFETVLISNLELFINEVTWLGDG